MRHAVYGSKLSRDIKTRKALLNNLANSLILHGSLKTTEAKAKFAAPYVEKIITLAKKNKLNANRRLASYLTHESFLKLTQEVAPGFNTRTGGYTRIIKLAPRNGDAAKMAKLELIAWHKLEKKPTGDKHSEKKGKKIVKNKPKTVASNLVKKSKQQTSKKQQQKKVKDEKH